MGLDTSVYLKIRHKRLNVEILSVPVAYWRKYFGLTTHFLEIARDPDRGYWIPANDEELEVDYITTCKSLVLRDYIVAIAHNIVYNDSPYWTQSFWGVEESRVHTAQQLSTLILADSICSTRMEDIRYWVDDLEALWNTAYYYKNPIPAFPLTETVISEIEKHPENFEFVVVFENSY